MTDSRTQYGARTQEPCGGAVVVLRTVRMIAI